MKYYVYELWGMIKDQLFYVGKGSGERTYSHTSKPYLSKPVVKYVFRADDEVRYKMGSSKRGKTESSETRKKKSESLMGHNISKKTRSKLSIGKKGKRPVCIELHKSQVGEGNPRFGKIWPDEKRQKISETNKGRKRSYREDGTWFFVYPEKV